MSFLRRRWLPITDDPKDDWDKMATTEREEGGDGDDDENPSSSSSN